MEKDSTRRNTLVVIVLMIIIGTGVILSNTIVPWVGEINRNHAATDIKADVKSHVTAENNELGGIVLDTFKENRGYGKSEHYNITQMLFALTQDVKEIKSQLNGSGTQCAC